MTENYLPEPDVPGFPGVYQIEVTDRVKGGPDGLSNRQAKELVERTGFLKKKTEALLAAIGSDLNFHDTVIMALQGKAPVGGVDAPFSVGAAAQGGHALQLGQFLSASLSFRNLLVNGDQRVAQQYGSVAQNGVASGTFVIDQWQYQATQAGRFTFQQVAGPVGLGFDCYSQFTVSGAFNPGATDYFIFTQTIEAQSITPLAWGTPNARPLSLQMVVNSSLTGTFSGALRNAAGTRSFPFTFTIPKANTDTVIKLPALTAGDVDGGWTLTGAVAGMSISICLGAGASMLGAPGAWLNGNYVGSTGTVNLVATAGAVLKITGVQLEPGPICTPHERPTPEMAWARCQRYLPSIVAGSATDQINIGYISNGTTVWVPWAFRLPPRAPITGALASSPSMFSLAAASGTQVATAVAFAAGGTNGGTLIFSGSGLVGGQSATALFNNASGKILFTGAQL